MSDQGSIHPVQNPWPQAYQTQQLPPVPPVPQHRGPQRPWWRRTWVAVLAAFLLGGGIAGATASGSSAKTTTKTVAGPTSTVVMTTTATATVERTTTPTKVVATRTATVRVTYTPPAPKSWTDGTYVVGTDIRPGVYKTTGQGDGSNSVGCYWARLASLDTSDITDNGIVTGLTTIQVQPGDKALELSGGCEWAKVG